MKRLFLALAISAMTMASSALLAADEAQDSAKSTAAPLSVEQQLLNDFAVRLKDHMHKTAMLLDKISQSKDPKERQKLMKEYSQAMQTTDKINQAMANLNTPGNRMGGMGMMGGMGKGGKKMGGMKCKCGMMKQSGAAKAAAGALEGEPEAAESEDADAAEASGHEGH